MRRRLLVTALLAGVVACGALWVLRSTPLGRRMVRRAVGRRTVAEVLEEYGTAAGERLRPHFERAGVPCPPARLALLAFKREKRLELWAAKQGEWAFVRSYPILAASGHAGPKLREGDRQVPEGLYRIVGLNPNSSYHLSMELDYPNEFDRRHAKAEGRTQPGSDIFIHGKAVSIGCLAMGDEAIEELFCLVARVGPSHVRVIIAPNDLRRGEPVTDVTTGPPWLPELHGQITSALAAFRFSGSGN